MSKKISLTELSENTTYAEFARSGFEFLSFYIKPASEETNLPSFLCDLKCVSIPCFYFEICFVSFVFTMKIKSKTAIIPTADPAPSIKTSLTSGALPGEKY